MENLRRVFLKCGGKMESYKIIKASACPMATLTTDDNNKINEIIDIINKDTVVKKGDDIHTWIEVNVLNKRPNMNTFKLMHPSTMPNVCFTLVQSGGRRRTKRTKRSKRSKRTRRAKRRA
jgi:hypothetical protein